MVARHRLSTGVVGAIRKSGTELRGERERVASERSDFAAAEHVLAGCGAVPYASEDPLVDRRRAEQVVGDVEIDVLDRGASSLRARSYVTKRDIDRARRPYRSRALPGVNPSRAEPNRPRDL